MDKLIYKTIAIIMIAVLTFHYVILSAAWFARAISLGQTAVHQLGKDFPTQQQWTSWKALLHQIATAYDDSHFGSKTASSLIIFIFIIFYILSGYIMLKIANLIWRFWSSI